MFASTESVKPGHTLMGNNSTRRWILAAACALVSLSASAVEPKGNQECTDTTGFHDGDTFTCVTDTGPLRVRVAGIDAPETGQAFWRVSRDLLRSITPAGSRVDCYKVDRYERQVCRVCTADGRDAALWLVESGLAWRTRKYADEQTPEERERYATAEATARNRSLGIWTQPDPQEPGACRELKEQRQKCR